MKHFKNTATLLLLMSVLSCDKHKNCSINNNLFGNVSEVSNDSILQLQRLKYLYENKAIFSIRLPINNPYEGFRHYLMADSIRVFAFSMYDCNNAGKYVIVNRMNDLNDDKNTTETNDNCYIFYQPIIDFSLNIGDTLHFQKNNNWITLDTIKYDVPLKDTLYQFISKAYGTDRETIVVCSKKGIFGIATGYYEAKKHCYWLNDILGHTPINKNNIVLKILPDSYTKQDFKYPSDNLSLIQQFKNCE